ncbi:hypothetical protein [Rhodovulum sulfidophilum]|nr:hypothetical protein [Rhodovulum sulfidophilum]
METRNMGAAEFMPGRRKDDPQLPELMAPIPRRDKIDTLPADGA